MDCYYCDAEASHECVRCGALYCDDHGGVLCTRCEDPALALPSYRIYRGSLLALLVGTLFAVWLLVKPAAPTDADSPGPTTLSGAVATPVAGPPDGTPAAGAATPTPTATPSATPSATPTMAPTASATATPTEAQPAAIEHIVQPGETLYSIALLYQPSGVDLDSFIEQIAAYNGIVDVGQISVGQSIMIPR